MLTWSPELISDRMALERCLKEAIHLRGYIETAALALMLAANAAWEPTRNPVKYPLYPRRPPLESRLHARPNGRGQPRAAANTANRSTAKADPPSDCN